MIIKVLSLAIIFFLILALGAYFLDRHERPHRSSSRRKLLWDWVEFRNGVPNTDRTGFVALNDRMVEDLINESREHPRWIQFIESYPQWQDYK